MIRGRDSSWERDGERQIKTDKYKKRSRETLYAKISSWKWLQGLQDEKWIRVLILVFRSRSYILAIQPLLNTHMHDCVCAYMCMSHAYRESSRGWNSCLSTIDEKDILWCRKTALWQVRWRNRGPRILVCTYTVDSSMRPPKENKILYCTHKSD